MILAYHLILTCYGFWLPNDPRGSWSDVVTAFALRPFGKATQTTTRRSVAHQPHNPTQRIAAKNALARPPVRFTGPQARCIANTLSDITRTYAVTFHAAAIMPDHLHAVVAKPHGRTIESLAQTIKALATQRLNKDVRTFDQTPWARGQWAVYLNDADAVKRAIRYVNDNPVKAGLKPQSWKFVKPFPV